MGYRSSLLETVNRIQIENASVLITGATGMIGSCLVETLLLANETKNANILIYALSRSLEKLQQKFPEGVTYVVQDICKPLDNSVKYDYIFHCASNADPCLYVSNPVETITTNVVGTQNVMEYCKANRETRVVFTSSFEVYGEIEGIEKITEEMSGFVDSSRVRNCYPESKRCAEYLVKSYVKEYGVKASIARLPGVFGPTMDLNDSKAHAQFIMNAVRGENIVLKSKGLQKRSYCYVVDVVDALLTILEKGMIGEAYNVAYNEAVSIAEFAEICARIAGVSVKFEEPTEGEKSKFSKSCDYVMDNRKLLSLGWKDNFSLIEGLAETISFLNSSGKK